MNKKSLIKYVMAVASIVGSLGFLTPDAGAVEAQNSVQTTTSNGSSKNSIRNITDKIELFDASTVVSKSDTLTIDKEQYKTPKTFFAPKGVMTGAAAEYGTGSHPR